MATLRCCLPEVLDIIVEHLVIAIGIQKAVLLRTVSRAFDAAIMYAVCTRQVIDIEDPATRHLLYRMGRRLRGKVLLQKSRTASASSEAYLQVIARVNRALDLLVVDTDPGETLARHETVAESVVLANYELKIDEYELQNLLSGAALTGSIAAVKLVLLRGGSSSAEVLLNAATPYFPTPLSLAAANGHHDLVQYLLDQGAHLATEEKMWRRGSDLMHEPSDWNVHSDSGHCRILQGPQLSALPAAVAGGHSDIVRLLLQPEHRPPTNSLEYPRAIVSGARSGRLSLIKMLFEVIGKRMSDFDLLAEYMMWEAVRGDQEEVVQMLLAEGVDLDAFPNRPSWWHHFGTLHLAASLNRTRLVKLLLDRGADPNLGRPRSEYGALPIEGAAIHGQEEAMNILLSYGADPARAFWGAAYGGQPRLMADLLSRFPDLTDVSVLRTCLDFAMKSCNLKAMTILVEAGVPLNDAFYDDDGKYRASPIDLAVEWHGWTWVIEHLISLGARPKTAYNEYDDSGRWRGHNSHGRGILLSKRTWNWVGKY